MTTSVLSVIALGRVVGSTLNVVSIGVVMSDLFVVELDIGILNDNDNGIVDKVVTMEESIGSIVE